MTPLQRRFKGVIERVGDGFTVGGSARKGVFAILPVLRALDYLPQADVDSSGRPMRLAYVPCDDATGAGDSVSWNSQTLSVKKAVEVRVQSVTVVRLLVLG